MDREIISQAKVLSSRCGIEEWAANDSSPCASFTLGSGLLLCQHGESLPKIVCVETSTWSYAPCRGFIKISYRSLRTWPIGSALLGSIAGEIYPEEGVYPRAAGITSANSHGFQGGKIMVGQLRRARDSWNARPGGPGGAIPERVHQSHAP
ncbi:hypothetical protein KM043_001351 [Ampulex compressa]|nr:hypothetical protein KM043_001351 [Ampulex compressa]